MIQRRPRPRRRGLTAAVVVVAVVVGWTASSPLASAQTVVRVNAGGAAIIDPTTGLRWEADATHKYYSKHGVAVDRCPQAIANTGNDNLYCSFRKFATATAAALPYHYQFPVPNGLYTVRLHFAETCVLVCGEAME